MLALCVSCCPCTARRSPSQALSPSPDQGRRRKNVLYAVMALVPELDEDDLVYVKREIEQRLGALGR